MVKWFNKKNENIDTTSVKFIIDGEETDKISCDTKSLSKLFVLMQKYKTKSMIFDMHKKTIFLEMEEENKKK